MSQPADSFATIHVEGGLLPADVLQRLAAGDADVPGLKPADYHLSGERVTEAAARSWSRLQGAWRAFGQAREETGKSAPTAGLTRNKWLSILFQELGFGQLEPVRASLSLGDRDYPVSHLWGAVPIHLVGYDIGLDEKRKGVVGAARMTPHGLVQEFLNRSDQHLWGISSNGLRLRLLRDNASLTRQAFVEFDLEAMLEGEIYSDFVLLWMLVHESRLQADVPEECWLERWREFAEEEGTRALDDLRSGVEDALRTLGQGFIDHPDNQDLRDAIRAGEITPEVYYRELLRIVYRLIFLFVSEDRGVLFDPEISEEARETYLRYYSTTRLRELARKQRGTSHWDLYEAIRLVWRALDAEGEPLLALYPLDGVLFAAESVSSLQNCRLENGAFLEGIRHLAYLKTDTGVRAVNYRLLGARELGSVYESLLELHPALVDEPVRFTLKVVEGSERKSTGSYYSPEPLIQLVLDQALDPLLEEATEAEDPEEAILDLKLVDPSVGGGHFLVSAAHRIAHRLAVVRSGDDEPPAPEIRHALRDVIGHCLYGIDLNPMAVELCKVALWMEAVEPGRPLSFLDHKIVVGNSMIGATPRGLDSGIPDDAFQAVEGDEKSYVTALRRNSSKERKSKQLSLTLAVASHGEDIASIAADAEAIEAIDDSTLEGVREQRRRWKELRSSFAYRRSKLIADAWTAAFVVPKRQDAAADITEGTYRSIRAEPENVAPALQQEISRLADRYGFFHWHLAFPDILRIPQEGEEAETEVAGWSGGFDLVFGNPPWDTMSPDKKEFFSAYEPQIRFEDREGQKKIVKRLLEHAEVGEKWREYRRDLYASVHFIKNSGRYQLFAPGNLGKGDFNTYRFFVETAFQAVRPDGWVSQIVPEGFYSGANAMAIREALFRRFRMPLLYGFENRREVWFKGVASGQKFAVYGANRGGTTEEFESAFNIRTREELAEMRAGGSLHIPISLVERFSPEALAISEFASQYEIDVASKMYGRWPAFGEMVEGQPYRHYMTEVHMGNDRELFTENPEEDLPVYEGRMVQQYDHRAKGYLEGRGRSAKWEEYTFGFGDKRIQPQWTVPHEDLPDKLGERPFRYRIGFCDAVSARNVRTLLATILPPGAVAGHKVPTIEFGEDRWYLPVWLAAANSFALDFLVRKLVSLSMTYTIMDSLPFPRPDEDAPEVSFLVPLVLKLVCTSPEMNGFWNEMAALGFVDAIPEEGEAPGVTDPQERLEIEARIDAFVAHEFYGLERTEMDYILSTFPIVERRQEKEYGEYLSRRLVLEEMDRLEATDVGEDAPAVLPFRRVQGPTREAKYQSVVPLHDLEAAAGEFGNEQAPSFEDWVEIDTTVPLKKGMFVARVVGRSMQPLIPDGAYCLFKFPVLTRPKNGTPVLVETHQAADQPGGRYTVKRLYSELASTEDGTTVHRARLQPENPEFSPIVIDDPEGENFRVIATLIDVL